MNAVYGMQSGLAKASGHLSDLTLSDVKNKLTLKTCLINMLATSLFIGIGTAQAQSNTGSELPGYNSTARLSDSVTRKVYGGIGFGMSWLEPDTSEVDGVDPNKRVNGAGQIMLGMDINKWLSIEGHAASLGEAGLAPSGSISYQTYGVSALAYAGKSRHLYNRRGFSGFGRVGYGLLKNEPSDNVNFVQVNSSHLLLGLGLEYATRGGLGVRAEAIAFDTDVRYGQLSLLYRFGKRRERRREMVAEAPVVEPTPVAASTPVPTPAPVVTPIPAVAVARIDSDADGVQDGADRCPNTQSGVAVDEQGCDLFNGVIEGVNFNSGSADLTANAQGVLNGVVSTLNQFPQVKLAIMAHTDSQGDAGSNKQLSRQRARSVAVYLVRNGVSAQRLKAYGFGEDRPIDTNETANGRSRNRRVEFRAAQ